MKNPLFNVMRYFNIVFLIKSTQKRIVPYNAFLCEFLFN
ncbi:hypothetical protein J2Z18_003173 [Paenibacillus lactis]|uniref:Uncharacterized protein n=2 Tax=Paenibacillus lactis TaxID=228574 RepID=G4HJF6_9BACL|nr:hypothetical protein PaelaDRAFT_4153 [Paenibacillus lactis 154]MBP1894070.1 hypothetical protein [Paenibacillus lactis]